MKKQNWKQERGSQGGEEDDEKHKVDRKGKTQKAENEQR